ncbi:hypothetical protein ACCD08_31845, partial [Telluria sp. Tellsp104]
MRHFFRAHWKAIVAIVLLVLLATMTVNPGAAMPEPPLAMRLRAHVTALAGGPRDATYIGNVLQAAGYAVQDRGGTGHARRIEAVLASVPPGEQAAGPVKRGGAPPPPPPPGGPAGGRGGGGGAAGGGGGPPPAP